MIARVRIAPVEKWCAQEKQDSDFRLAGKEIEIITMRMISGNHFDGVKARVWPLSEDCEKEICKLIEHPEWIGLNVVICEHMLEMD